MQKIPNVTAEIAAKLAAAYDADDDLTNLSNAAVDLVHAGKLDEAEQLAHDLLERFPDVPDGYDRLGMIYEARGDQRPPTATVKSSTSFEPTLKITIPTTKPPSATWSTGSTPQPPSDRIPFAT